MTPRMLAALAALIAPLVFATVRTAPAADGANEPGGMLLVQAARRIGGAQPSQPHRLYWVDADTASRRLKVLPSGRVLAWSPNGSAFVSEEKTGVLIHETNDARVRRLARPGCTKCVYGSLASAAWAPTGSQLVYAITATDQRSRIIVATRTGMRIREITPATPRRFYDGISWSPDGRWIAVRRLDEYRTRDLALIPPNGGAATPVVTLREHHDSPSFSWSPDGRYLALGTEGRDPRDPSSAVFDTSTRHFVFTCHGEHTPTSPPGRCPWVASWMPDSLHLVYPWEDGYATLTHDGTTVMTHSVGRTVLAVAASPDGRFLALTFTEPEFARELSVLDLRAGSLRRILRVPSAWSIERFEWAR